MTTWWSCTKDVNFSQLNDLTLSPAVVSSLVFFDEPANTFYDNGSEVSAIQDFIMVDIFNNAFVQDDLVKSEFHFESKNAINRSFILQIDFFDISGKVLHTFQVSQEASGNAVETVSHHIEVFEGDDIEVLKQTQVVMFTLRVAAGQPIDEHTPGRIQLKSFASFYFEIDVSE
ncbi:hypothetical protein KFZ70_07775 [Tamlana fucoidanivorans]|uniref:Uncharacterized protein n=1 Tax=Allotamlana fucoidanivorans TaxID=2583814 RepID=A0A5C4SIX1_9FLAO|nr:hypothetical protein [Tamlana fucoidanivorans]TNJ43776.1 hypothetical protein FGF67_10420 [Tamlana fucoidanivorans]